MIYMDNAATSWPKPATVYKAVTRCMEKYGANPGRSGHRMSVEAGNIVLCTREFLCELFNIDDPFKIVFTQNCTDSINLALKGLLKPGDHAITTSMEHNAVIRPLMRLKSQGIELSVVSCDPLGRLDPNDIRNAIKKNTRLIVTTHASNVTGTIMPIKEIGMIAREYGIPYLVDAAQTAGILPIDVNELNIDMLAFPGHKGLLGPQGTGGLYISSAVDLTPLKEGGTGSQSESMYQPDLMPDKFESGTLNTPGIAGLAAGIEYIFNYNQKKLFEKEKQMDQLFLEALTDIKSLKIYGPVNPAERLGAISINISDRDSSEIADILDERYNIAVRGSLHCAPLAHDTIGTLHQGTVRFSPGIYSTIDDVYACIKALEELAAE